MKQQFLSCGKRWIRLLTREQRRRRRVQGTHLNIQTHDWRHHSHSTSSKCSGIAVTTTTTTTNKRTRCGADTTPCMQNMHSGTEEHGTSPAASIENRISSWYPRVSPLSKPSFRTGYRNIGYQSGRENDSCTS